MATIKRLLTTSLAEKWVTRLTAMHGPLMFYQSGGCCEGSAPLCMPNGDMQIGDNDVYLGKAGDAPFYMSSSQFEYWQHTQLILDVVPGGGNAFSLESPEGISFHTRSHVFTDEENAELEKQGPVLRGLQV
jgi:uncharacterized protein (DUF779 family)